MGGWGESWGWDRRAGLLAGNRVPGRSEDGGLWVLKVFINTPLFLLSSCFLGKFPTPSSSQPNFLISKVRRSMRCPCVGSPLWLL